MARRSVIFLSFLAIVVTGLRGQQTTGAIRGIVTDASGGAVAGAAVTATNNDTSVSASSFTRSGNSLMLTAPAAL